MPAPCGGCPPCCKRCVFDAASEDLAVEPRIIVQKDAYGCIRPDGGDIVVANGTLGMLRGKRFHPVTAEGAEFLNTSGNSLASHC